MIEWSLNPDGTAIARDRDRSLCSPRDPLKEARLWCDHHESVRAFSVIRVVGIGAGYHLFELARRHPSLVIEAFDSRIDLAPGSCPPALSELAASFGRRLRSRRISADPGALASFIGAVPVLAFRPACGEEELAIHRFLLGQDPEAFREGARLSGYPALASARFPEGLAVNIKSVPVGTGGERENLLIEALRELVR